MSNLLIGSSNLARFYKPEKFKEYRPYQMMKCTTMDSFVALMAELEDGCNKVVISVFENIIADAAKASKTDDNQDGLISEAIKITMELIGKTAARLPDSSFCIVMPLMRPALKWYQEKLPKIEDDIRNRMADVSASGNVTRVNCVCHSLQQFEVDGVHLTMDSGVIFLAAPQPDTCLRTSPCCSEQSRTTPEQLQWPPVTSTFQRVSHLRSLHRH